MDKEKIKKYEERSNPLLKFIDENCEEEPENFIILNDFVKIFNEFLKNNRLRVMKTNKVSYALRQEGFNVGAKKIKDENGNIIKNTTVIFGLDIQTHSNPSISKTTPYVKNQFESEWVSMGLSDHNEEKSQKKCEKCDLPLDQDNISKNNESFCCFCDPIEEKVLDVLGGNKK